LKGLNDNAVDFVLPDLFRLRIDSSVAKLSKKNDCPVAISLSWILNSTDIVRALRKTTEAIETLEYYNAPGIFATFAIDELETRGAKDLENLLDWLGSERPRAWLERAGNIVERNKKRAGEAIPGVREMGK
jgi:RNase P/RNase MRP subunit p30